MVVSLTLSTLTNRKKIMRLLQTCLLLTLLLVFGSVAVAQTGAGTIVIPAVTNEPNKPKHNQVVVEFPGHSYTLEVAVKQVKEKVDGEERSVYKVFAYVSDAHFGPRVVDTKEVRLNFVIDRQPKSFVLLPVKADADVGRDIKDTRPQSVFELNDPALTKLIVDGWQGAARAQMLVGRTPYTAQLMKAKDFVPHRH